MVKNRYSVEPRSAVMVAASAFLCLSILLRLAWWILWPEQLSGWRALIHGILPLAACALFLVTLLRWGRTALGLSAFPCFLGVLFFILKATTFVWWHQLLCTLLYLAVAALYGLTVFGLPIRKLLLPLFGLPLAFHLFVEDLAMNRTVYTAAQWLQEGSVLCIMASLFCISLAMQSPAPREAGRRLPLL